jgi:transcriptional regulator with XRE-family HTH domain
MDYQELRGLIRAQYRTQEAFATDLDISACSLSKKLNGRTEWAADEIRKACELLGISPEHIPRYFFCSMC